MQRERREIGTQKRTPTNPDTDSDEPKNWLRLTQKTQNRARSSSNAQTHSSNPENPFDRTILDPHRADRTTGKIVAPQHRSTQNRWFSSHPKTNRSRAIFVRYWEFGFVSFGFWWIWVFSLIQLRPPQPRFVIPDPASSSPFIKPSHLSLSLSLNLNGFDEFFLLGFVSFVFIY